MITTSSSFIGPVITSCFVTWPPSWRYTTGIPPALLNASSGTYNATPSLSVSIAFPVVMPGRSVVSACRMVTFISKTFASAFGRCSPTFATLATVPVRCLVGSASSVTITGCPTASFRTSISLTYVTDSICVRSGKVATLGSQALTCEPTVRLRPFHSFT